MLGSTDSNTIQQYKVKTRQNIFAINLFSIFIQNRRNLKKNDTAKKSDLEKESFWYSLSPLLQFLYRMISDDADLSPTKLEKYRSSKPLLSDIKTESDVIESDSKLETPLKFMHKDLFSYSRAELEDILKKVIHKSPSLAQEIMTTSVPNNTSPPRNFVSSTNSSQVIKDQKMIEGESEELESKLKLVAKHLNFSDPISEKELNNLEVDLSGSEEVEFDVLFDADPNSEQGNRIL